MTLMLVFLKYGPICIASQHFLTFNLVSENVEEKKPLVFVWYDFLMSQYCFNVIIFEKWGLIELSAYNSTTFSYVLP